MGIGEQVMCGTAYSFVFSICDVIQQKVHKVGKLIFPNAVEIGSGDRKEH